MTTENVLVEKCQFSDSKETAWNVFVNGNIVGRVCKFKDTATDVCPYSVRLKTESGPWAVVETVWARDHKNGTAARKHAIAELVRRVA